MATSAETFLLLCKPLRSILSAIKQAGGCAYAVGGCVRDLILERKIKDIDIEVHAITIEQLEEVLGRFGHVQLIGKQFGVLLLQGLDVDWAVPRRDSKGRKPTVAVDPTMNFAQAARRRDVTMNAMGIDLHEIIEQWDFLESIVGNHKKFLEKLMIVDPYNGLEALKKKQLSAVDERLFLEDPLRFFRVMQFIGRFEMKPDAALQKLCASMELADVNTGEPIAKERIFGEIKKLLLQSRQPSRAFRWLQEIGRLKELFPELYMLIGAAQRKDYHPEGDVFEHAMQVVDCAAQVTDYKETRLFSHDDEKLMICVAALCHDMGKPVSTDENLCSRGHDIAGVPIARSFISRFAPAGGWLCKNISKLVRLHMQPLAFMKGDAKAKAYKRLAKKLAPTLSIRQLGLLARCDWRGRNGESVDPLPEDPMYEQFLSRAEKAGVLDGAEPALLQGRHLLDEIMPGKEMGDLLDKAYELQIEEGITDIDELKKRVLKTK